MADLESGRNVDEEEINDFPSVLLSLRSSSLSEPLNPRVRGLGAFNEEPPPRRAISYESHHPQPLEVITPPVQQQQLRDWRNLLPIHLIQRIASAAPPVPMDTISASPSTIEIFYCQICLENQPLNLSIQLLPCQCRFCRDTLCHYYETLIQDGQVNSFHCPSCQTEISSSLLQQIISPQSFLKYLRFVKMKTYAGYRECPFCQHPMIGSDETTIICDHCHESYCYLHSNAHQGMKCEEYLKLQKENEKKNKKIIQRLSRRCPSCGCHTEKNGGCNHMTCRACGEVRLKMTTLLLS
jgi:hypothetical protein